MYVENHYRNDLNFNKSFKSNKHLKKARLISLKRAYHDFSTVLNYFRIGSKM